MTYLRLLLLLYCDCYWRWIEWVSPPQWRFGHTLDSAVRPNKLRNVCGAGIGGTFCRYTNHALHKADELSMRKTKLCVRMA